MKWLMPVQKIGFFDMLTHEQTTRAIEAGIAGQVLTWEIMLAAIEGTTIGVCYLAGIKTNSEFVTYSALRSLVEGVEREQRAEVLGL